MDTRLKDSGAPLYVWCIAVAWFGEGAVNHEVCVLLLCYNHYIFLCDAATVRRFSLAHNLLVATLTIF